MLKHVVIELIETVRINLAIAQLRFSGYGRQRFRTGFDDGYRTGRDHERRGLPPVSTLALPNHPQIEVDGVEVDVNMAPLLQALWKLGLDTQYSCQGDPDHFVPHQPLLHGARSQIVFADIHEAYKFVDKTMELMGNAAWGEGGIDVSTMEPTDGETFRAAVWFSPQLLIEVTDLWIAFETTVPAATSD